MFKSKKEKYAYVQGIKKGAWWLSPSDKKAIRKFNSKYKK